MASIIMDEIVHGGHLAALAGASMVLTFGLINGDPLNLPLLGIVYLGTLIIYSYNYFSEMGSDNLTNPERVGFLKQKAKIYPYLLAGYVTLLAALILLFHGNVLQLAAAIAILVTAGVVYTLGLKRLTKYIPGFKSFYVAGEWSLSIVLMYSLYCQKGLFDISLPIFGFILIKVLSNVIFYDMKDIESDTTEGLKTIPILLGWNGTVKFLYLLNLVSLAPILLGIYTGELHAIALIMAVFVVYDFYYLYMASRSRGDFARKYYVFADFEFTCWPIMTIISIVALGFLSPMVFAAGVILIVLALLWIGLKTILHGHQKGIWG